MQNARVKYQFILVLFLFNSLILSGQTMNIRINQIGYYPEATKIAIVVWSDATDFEVVKVSDSTVVFSGQLSQSMYSSIAEDSVKWADFSALTTPGKYFVRIEGFGNSLSFDISKNVLRPVAYGAMKSYYYQRCSHELTEEYAGTWARKAGHLDQNCIFDESTGNKGTKACPGGWYDAGDYGKYVINAGVSVGTLLQIYENFPSCYADSTLAIPESGNGKNDLLDEVKYELDWLKTMQDRDGGVFCKITSEYYADNVMPDKDILSRYIYGKLTGTTLDFAAMMAMAGRIYIKYDSLYASDCIEKAEKAWSWAKANLSIYDAPGGTGIYPDDTVSDEFFWAAAELLITTGKDEYKTYLESDASVLYYKLPSWKHVKGLGYLSLATHSSSLNETELNAIKNLIINKAESVCNEINSDPYRIANTGFTWGTNALHGNTGIVLVYAYILTKDLKYIKAAAEIADFFLGKNATAYSFITFYGHKTPMNILHRPSISDKIAPPVPGFLVGGTNDFGHIIINTAPININDRPHFSLPGLPVTGTSDNGNTSADTIFIPPLKAYEDDDDNPVCNEVAINWNASATAVLAAVDNIMGDSSLKIDFKPLQSVKIPPSVDLTPYSDDYKIMPYIGSFGKNQEINIVASLSKPSGIKRTELYVDSKLIDAKIEVPYKFTLNNLLPGCHIISVNVIDTNELVTEKNIIVTINMYTDIPNKLEKNNEQTIAVSPNPVTENSIIRYSVPLSGTYNFEVYDLSGKKLTNKEVHVLTYEEYSINWRDLNINGDGLYLIVIKSNGHIVASAKAIAIE